MSPDANSLKIIIATLGLETHYRGAIIVAKGLKELGLQVIYLPNVYPDEIIDTAIREKAEVIGISTLSGGHLILGYELFQIAQQHNIKEKTLFLIGGVVPPVDIPQLKEIGFQGVFGPGTAIREIYDFIKIGTVPKTIEENNVQVTLNMFGKINSLKQRI
jgi:methylmalonyl-CoA mutase C-terminal domain/subunit